jgi:hypothetical protein
VIILLKRENDFNKDKKLEELNSKYNLQELLNNLQENSQKEDKNS